MYIGPEFLLGQVYDGTTECGESIVLYRPVYPTVKPGNKNMQITGMNNSISSQPQSSASTPTATKGLKVDFSKESQHPLILQAQQAKSSANTTSSLKGSQPQPCSSKSTSSKDNENANAAPGAAGESDIMTTASHETSAADEDLSSHIRNSSDGALKTAKTSSSDSGKDNNKIAKSDDSKKEGKKKIRISSTSSTTGEEQGGEVQKHAKNVVTFSSSGIKDAKDASRHSCISNSGGGAPSLVGTGSESKIEKADKNVTKKVFMNQEVLLPGRAVKLESSTSTTRKSLSREESLGESSSSVSVHMESAKATTTTTNIAQMIKDSEEKTKI